ncbi:MAG: LysR family transcriptional regulator [Pseudomonadota bacterium]
MTPKTTPDQWQILATVVDRGGFAQAAQALHRSQSAVSYALAHLQESLGVQLLEIQGRKAQLTAAGRELLRRSRPVIEQFERLESLAQSLKQGWESELRLVVDAAFPQERLLALLGELQNSCPNTTVSLADAVLSGAEEAIKNREADLVVTTRVPPNVLGDWLMDVSMIAVAAAGHPLHQQGSLSLEDLIPYTQVVVRDSGREHPRDEGWLGAQHRWTVSGVESSLAAVRAGLAYAWLPANRTAKLIESGELKPLPLQAGATRKMSLYVVLAKGQAAGPAARTALELLQRHLPANAAIAGDAASQNTSL